MDNEQVIKEVVEKGGLYLKYRTTIWATVWFLVGLFGGNADRIKTYVPTLNYSTPEIEQKLQEYHQLQKKIEKVQKELDKMTPC